MFKSVPMAIRTTTVSAGFLAITLALSACGGSGETKVSGDNVVNIYNWAEYIAPGVLEQFEVEYDIKINYDIYDSAEVVDVKLLAATMRESVLIVWYTGPTDYQIGHGMPIL